MPQLSLSDAVERHVRPGDTVQILCGHSRWTAAAREMARQFWGTDAGFTLVMISLSSLGALFFRGGMVRKVVTTYSGDTFPTYTPNPVFQEAYASGAVEVEHWSILTYTQRLEAAARGLPALVTGSLKGSSMDENDAFATVASPFGPVGLLAPLVPDVTLVHGAVADVAGNVVLSEPLLEGAWGAWAARRGVIATVEHVVDKLDGIGHRTKIPAHRVLAVVEAPFGAHPGGLYAPGLPARSYGEDIGFWTAARAATRGDFDAWAREWVLEPATHEEYLDRVGNDRLGWLGGRTDPLSWRADADAHPVDEDEPASAWEQAAAFGAREVLSEVYAVDADAVLAGAGVANLAAWVAVVRAGEAGHRVKLTAELGMWGYTPTPADPYIFNHRVFPGTPMLTDASTVLGMVVGGPGTRTIACLGAAQIDSEGNLNSTTIPGGPFLVGSGGANDVASRAAACVVVSLARPERLVERVGYVTSPGHRVTRIVTDRGVLRRNDGVLRIAAVPSGPGSVAERVHALADVCGWNVEAVRTVEELEPVTHDEVMALRRYDPERLFLA
ncbi:MAG TPA: CoA-transferase [Acidimicrobiales bacterium]|jgi:acyl CoA:acetate/3-ketoacid CoA transferase alpha subunit/acyl CoA:acetate/3-ketoacid CoA transferase beta subunit